MINIVVYLLLYSRYPPFFISYYMGKRLISFVLKFIEQDEHSSFRHGCFTDKSYGIRSNSCCARDCWRSITSDHARIYLRSPC